MVVPPAGGSLEIGNTKELPGRGRHLQDVPPSGGSLEIGNAPKSLRMYQIDLFCVPPSGGSLEIGN